MKIDQYVRQSEHFNVIARYKDVLAANLIIEAAKIMRDEALKKCIDTPMISDNVKKDMRYQLGIAKGLSKLIELPDRVAEHLNKLK